MKHLLIILSLITYSQTSQAFVFNIYEELEGKNINPKELIVNNYSTSSKINTNNGTKHAETVPIPNLTIKGKSLIQFNPKEPTINYSDPDLYKILLMPGEYKITLQPEVFGNYYFSSYITSENSPTPIWNGHTNQSFSKTLKIENMASYYIIASTDFNMIEFYKQNPGSQPMFSSPKIFNYKIIIEKIN